MEYIGLYISYGIVAVIVLLLYAYTSGKIWGEELEFEFERPWREFTYAILACFGVIAIGQIYVAGIRFPVAYPILDVINQILIFSPVILLVMLRDKSSKTVLITPKNVPYKLLSGLVLALLAIVVYTSISGSNSLLSVLTNTYNIKNVHYLAQVFLEDITIAMLFVRLKKASSLSVALFVVPCLFAFGHIPAMIANGVSTEAFLSLLLDAGLGFFLVYTINKSNDILWFWMVHFAMDMMQFYA